MPDEFSALVARLRCPLNGAALAIERAPSWPRDAALLTGGRQPYPMLLGIPRLLDDALRRPLVALLRAGRPGDAARLALQWPTRAPGSRLRRRLTVELARRLPGATVARGLAGLSDARRVQRPHGSFAALVAATTPPDLAGWLLHRFAARPFLPLVALAARLVRPGVDVLEVGGGVGHSSFVLARHAGAARVVCMDNVFAHLHAARRFNAPGTMQVCADAEGTLPFADGAFGCVAMTDSFHFVRDQERLAAEVCRVLATEGQVVLAHVHNGLHPDPHCDAARAPDAYASFFATLSPVLLRNDRLLAQLDADGRVDLTAPALGEAVEEAASLSLVARRDRPLPGVPAGAEGDVWHAVWARRTRLIANPLLGVAAPTSHLAEILVSPEPEDGDPPRAAMAGMMDPALASALLRRRMLLDVPDRFV